MQNSASCCIKASFYKGPDKSFILFVSFQELRLIRQIFHFFIKSDRMDLTRSDSGETIPNLGRIIPLHLFH